VNLAFSVAGCKEVIAGVGEFSTRLIRGDAFERGISVAEDMTVKFFGWARVPGCD
jgi:hypothetical protein